MLHRLRSRLTYANVVGSLALFFALAGGSAVALTGSNTVFNDDIVDDEVTTADVRNDNLAFGGLYQPDLGPNSVASSEIASGAVTSSELAPFSINEGDIAPHVIDNRHINPGTLNDEDISQGTFVSFVANIPAVAAQSCRDTDPITGINAQGDHLLLTPADDTNLRLTFQAIYSQDVASAVLRVCNNTNAATVAATAHFNLLVIDAQ